MTKSFSSAICANWGLISELTCSNSTTISGAHASFRARKNTSRIIEMTRDSVAVNIRVGGSALAGPSPGLSEARRFCLAGIPLPVPPKKLSSEENTSVGSIITNEKPRSGLIRMVLTASGGRISFR